MKGKFGRRALIGVLAFFMAFAGFVPGGTQQALALILADRITTIADCGDSFRDSAKMRTSVVAFASISRVASIRPNALRPGNSWCSASPFA